MNEINIAAILSRKRRDRGLTQDDLAAHMGVSKASVSKWETGQSYPDITLLPKLAAYFDLTIDELVDYHPQLDKAAIRTLYHELAQAFAAGPFEEALSRCEEAIKSYYACYPLLMQMAVLLANHCSLAPTPEKGQALLAEAIALTQRIRQESADVWLNREALSLEGMCWQFLGQPEKLAALYGDTIHPLSTDTGQLALTYQKMAQPEKARQVLQVDMYQHLLFLVDEGSMLLSFYQDQPERAECIIERTTAVLETFALAALHPIVALNFYMASAMHYAEQADSARTLAQLTCYTNICIGESFTCILHGDAYFDLIDPWLNDLTLGTAAPRDPRLIKEGLIQNITQNPALAFLLEDPRLEQLVQKLRFHLLEA